VPTWVQDALETQDEWLPAAFQKDVNAFIGWLAKHPWLDADRVPLQHRHLHHITAGIGLALRDLLHFQTMEEGVELPIHVEESTMEFETHYQLLLNVCQVMAADVARPYEEKQPRNRQPSRAALDSA